MGVLGLGREAHFSEFNDPLDLGSGVISPSVRKQTAAANLGIMLSLALGGATVLRQMPVPATATASATLTTTQVLNGVIHATPAAAVNYTLPTAAAIDALLLDFAVGDAFEFVITNLSTTAANDITVLTAAGWTLVGNMVVGGAPADGSEWGSGVFRARKTAANAYTLYRI